jgi:hypothetical protein
MRLAGAPIEQVVKLGGRFQVHIIPGADARRQCWNVM